MTEQEQRSRIDELEQALWSIRSHAVILGEDRQEAREIFDITTRLLDVPLAVRDISSKWYQPSWWCDKRNHRYYGEKRCSGDIEAVFTEVEP